MVLIFRKKKTADETEENEDDEENKENNATDDPFDHFIRYSLRLDINFNL